jgi:hypothetical protein
LKRRTNWSRNHTGAFGFLVAMAHGFGSRGSGARNLRLVIALALLLVTFLALSAGAAYAATVVGFKEAFGSASQPTFGNPTAMAVDGSGDLLVMDQTAGTVSRFNPDGTPDDFSTLGTNVISETPEGPLVFAGPTEEQIAVDGSGGITDGDIYVTQKTPPVVDIFKSDGEYLGRLTGTRGEAFSGPSGVAVDGSGNVYVSDEFGTGIQEYAPSANPPVNGDYVKTIEPELGFPAALAAGTGPSDGALFTLNFFGALLKLNASTGATDYRVEVEGGVLRSTATIDPATGEVLTAHGESITAYDGSGAAAFAEQYEFAVPSKVQGVATDSAGNIYVSREGLSGLEVWAPLPVPILAVSPPTGITPGAVVLGGSVNDLEQPLTSCTFEYGTAASESFAEEVPCEPAAADIPVDANVHSIAAAVSGLRPNTAYQFRISARNGSGPQTSEVGTFTTTGPPQITELGARDATQTSAILGANVNPSGFETSYYFEWGATAAYGNRAPATVTPTLGPGQPPTFVTAEISGLAAATTYHFRLVATSAAGTNATTDQDVETLDSCGLPDGRCLEMVSPKELGPVAAPGRIGNNQRSLPFQASDGPGSLDYAIDSGLPDATRGAEVLYQASRSATGWSSAQIDPPVVAHNEQKTESIPNYDLGVSPDLSCAVLASYQPLTSDATGQLALESGGSNLYRRNPDGSFTLVSDLPPENPGEGSSGGEYQLVGMSDDCNRIVFSTEYRYPGVTGAGIDRLYEWDEGTLTGIGLVPGETGPVAVEAEGGGGSGSFLGAVSRDGSRIFYSARRVVAGNPGDAGEVGKTGIFARDGGATVVDVSASETTTPDEGATFQGATPDGSQVYFTANAGLTSNSSIAGTDLYEYDFATSTLTDLSVASEAGGASVGGLVGFAENGSHVYFGAQGQLSPGKGRTYAENRANHSYSIYDVAGSGVRYVGVVTQKDMAEGFSNTAVRNGALGGQSAWTSRVSPDGRFLLFESSANVTGYDSEGAKEVYLYDGQAPTEPTVCVSCRSDGNPPIRSFAEGKLEPGGVANPLYAPHSLVMRDGQPTVFFRSLDALATNAVDGEYNLYEWSHGQVFLIAHQPLGTSGRNGQAPQIQFAGASTDGTDLYFFDAAALNWENSEGRYAAWDAREGGGFAQPTSPQEPCDPNVEASCQHPSAGPSSTPEGATKTFIGPGNPKHKKKHQNPKHKKKHQNPKHKKKHQNPKHKKKHQNPKHKKKHQKAEDGQRHGTKTGGAGK